MITALRQPSARVVAMSRPSLILILACAVVAGGCSAVAVIGGVPKIVSVTITAPAGLLVGDSATAIAVAMGDDGRDHLGRPRQWSSSDPAALSIDANGKMRGADRRPHGDHHMRGRRHKGTATVRVASDDTRFGYAFADQPTAAGPYAPPAGTSFNSGGGTVEVTRDLRGRVFGAIRGTGSPAGPTRQRAGVRLQQRTDAVQASTSWSTNGADLIVPVLCFDPAGNPADSRFTIMALGAWAFGKTAPLVFAVVPSPVHGGLGSIPPPPRRNSTGGHVDAGRDVEGRWGLQFVDLASAWQAAPAAIQLTAVGHGPRRCRAVAYDKPSSSIGILCTAPDGSTS